ncbi:MAG: TIGR00730 family Rossman fold protein [Anaerolineaceae bacterium]|jgi:uncharacterized protein (TIGR00730 family)
MKRICVFCGSSPGARPEYLDAAAALGQALARRGLGLVYGGGRLGLMGAIARAALAAGGEVTGVIPRGLVEREVGFTELNDLRVVESMHERKALMIELSDGFIALPGGLGTIEEFFEALTWGQLGLHQKPCGLLNVSGYFDHLVAFLDNVRAEQFVDDQHRAMIIMEHNPDRLLDRFAAYQHPAGDKAAWTLRLSQDRRSAR